MRRIFIFPTIEEAKAAHPECRRVLLMVAEDMRARGLMRNIPHLDEE